jgi:site-specific DNA-adenine methylase
MKKTHYPIGYFGNKRQEVEKIYNSIKKDLDKIEYIIEPFCGTSCFSYYLSLKHPKKFKYILNDNNKYLMEFYECMKDDNKFNELIERLNALMEQSQTKEDYNKIKMDENMTNWIFKNKYYNIRPNLYPASRVVGKDIFNNMKNYDVINFLKNEDITMTCEDGILVYDKYKSNPKCLIFLDPPYLSSENSFYKEPSTKIYEYLHDNDINQEKAKILLCLENIWIIKLLFKNKKSIVYDKKYETNKKITKHIIILNKQFKKTDLLDIQLY